MLAARSRAHLLVVDLQDGVLPALASGPRLLECTIRLIGCARRLSIPITVIEHEPARHGTTSALLKEAAGGQTPVLARTAFSAWRDDAMRQRLRALRQSGRDQTVLAGAEAHVAICQSALDLLAETPEVMVVADAIASRRDEDRELAMRRMSRAGVALVSREMVCCEWLERSGTAEYNDLLPLIEG